MNQNKLEKAIRNSVHELLKEKKYVSTVDLLIRLNYLSEADYEKWRFGKIEFLEKVCKVNLSRLNFINRSLNIIGSEMNLRKSWTAYMKYGKGPKVRLRFSKSNDEKIEQRYSTHYVLQEK